MQRIFRGMHRIPRCLNFMMNFNNLRWQVDVTETDEVRISHGVTNFEVIK